MTASSKAERRTALAAVAAYHESELRKLIERLRAGLARYDAGEIDAFELDELVHHYKRATQKLWSFCTGSGGQIETAARTLQWLRQMAASPTGGSRRHRAGNVLVLNYQPRDLVGLSRSSR